MRSRTMSKIIALVVVTAFAQFPISAKTQSIDAEVTESNARLVPAVLDVHAIDFVYPEEARTWGAQGIMGIAFFVKANGAVSKVEAVVPTGLPDLDKGVIKALKKQSIRGKPATLDGKSVGMWVYVVPAFFMSKEAAESVFWRNRMESVKSKLEKMEEDQAQQLLTKKR
jgi:TonB family protein